MGFRFSNITAIQRTYRAARASPLYRPSVIGGILRPLPAAEDENHLRIYRRWHVGHSHDRHVGNSADGVFRVGLAADTALAAGKALTGYITGSTAIVADAAHSVSDVVLSGVALWSFNAAKAPKDKEHPYGHGKFETMGALGISCMLLMTAGGIGWHAVDVLQGLLTSAPDIINHALHHGLDNNGHTGHHHKIDLEYPVLALGMTIISISVKEGLYWITRRAGEREGSPLMIANAWHHRSDAVSSVVALVGVGGAILGVPFLDPLAGLVVSGMILKAGIETGYQSVMELVDAGVPLPVLAPIKQTILEVEGVKGCHGLRGRKAGSFIYLDVHVEVDPFLSVTAAHDIGENVRHQIQKSHNQVAEVFVHIDPSFSNSPSIPEPQKKSSSIQSQNLTIQKEAECVYNTLSSLFPEKMSVEHITRHSLQGKFILQVQVSMPPDMLIRDAMDIAKEAEEILKAAANVSQASIQLRLGHPIPQLHSSSGKEEIN